MLDREGNPIESQFNYTLEPAKSSMPMTPMTLRGMYSIWLMRRPLLIARLENVLWWRITQSWSVATWARGNGEKPVLLSVEGHFTLEANPDTVAPTK